VDGPYLPIVTAVSPSYLGCSSSGIPADDKDEVSNGEKVEDPPWSFRMPLKRTFFEL
jgi:hypothetical protein